MNIRIPLSAPDITETEIAAVTAVLRTPQLSMGPELDAFERALATYHSVTDAVVVSSGTAALHLALVTLGVGQGHEVILPSFAFIALANAILQVGADPVFVDIDPLTLNLDPARIEAAVTPRTRAIIAVHTFGIPADMNSIRSIATRYGLVVIEDACEAIGAEIACIRVGGFGDLAVLGFYPNKQITTGEGGAVLVRNPAHAARLRCLRNQGRRSGTGLDQHEPGFNYRLSEMECALGRVQLSRISEILAARREAAERYQALLVNIQGLILPPLKLRDMEISWFVYVIRTESATVCDKLQKDLAASGIATSRYFAPIHVQPSMSAIVSRASLDLNVTEAIEYCTLALPFFNRITAEQQREIASLIRRSLAERPILDT